MDLTLYTQSASYGDGIESVCSESVHHCTIGPLWLSVCRPHSAHDRLTVGALSNHGSLLYWLARSRCVSPQSALRRQRRGLPLSPKRQQPGRCRRGLRFLKAVWSTLRVRPSSGLQLAFCAAPLRRRLLHSRRAASVRRCALLGLRYDSLRHDRTTHHCGRQLGRCRRRHCCCDGRLDHRRVAETAVPRARV